MAGVHITRSDTTVATRYFHKDHLGSIAFMEGGLTRGSFPATIRIGYTTYNAIVVGVAAGPAKDR